MIRKEVVHTHVASNKNPLYMHAQNTHKHADTQYANRGDANREDVALESAHVTA